MEDVIFDYLTQAAKANQLVFYSDLAPLVDLDMGNPLDRAELGRLLEEVNVEELAIGCPLLSSIVVHKSDNQPGNGFYNCARGLGQLSSKKKWTKSPSGPRRSRRSSLRRGR